MKKKTKKGAKKENVSDKAKTPLKCFDGQSLCEPNKKPPGFCSGRGG